VKATKVLVVDDDPLLRRTLEGQLSALGYEPALVADGAAADTLVQSGAYNLVLLDLKLPDTNGLTLLKRWKERHPHMIIIMMSGQGTIPEAVDALKHQAADFLIKPIDVYVLQAVLRRSLEAQILAQDNQRLRQLTRSEDIPFQGKSAVVLSLLETAKKVAPSDQPVLLEGETGTGKQVLARHIHAISGRISDPFVAINCASITQSLFESELFGHEKGAFTGAYTRKAGKLELVGEGTLFLDEIGELPMGCQAKLLTVVEERTFERVGGTRSLNFSGRIIAATNRMLEREMEAGNFRRDLFYRLSTFRFMLPALREHLEDLPVFIESMLKYCGRKYARNYAMPNTGIINRLARYPWPGNVRELNHHIERIALLSSESCIPENLWLSFPAFNDSMSEQSAGDLAQVTAMHRKQHVLKVLKQCQGNQTEAAKVLNVGRTYLNRLLSKYREEDGENAPR
jgi:DNA-binding NtrC family response regulator